MKGLLFGAVMVMSTVFGFNYSAVTDTYRLRKGDEILLSFECKNDYLRCLVDDMKFKCKKDCYAKMVDDEPYISRNQMDWEPLWEYIQSYDFEFFAKAFGTKVQFRLAITEEE